jgi:hypothetical protein
MRVARVARPSELLLGVVLRTVRDTFGNAVIELASVEPPPARHASGRTEFPEQPLFRNSAPPPAAVRLPQPRCPERQPEFAAGPVLLTSPGLPVS